MKKRFSEEQIIGFLREAEASPEGTFLVVVAATSSAQTPATAAKHATPATPAAVGTK